MSSIHNPLAFWNQQQNEIRIQGEVEYRREQGNKAPRRTPGDRYPIGGAFVGIIIGVILGARTGVPVWFIVGVVGGGIAGTLLGALLGTGIAKYRKSGKTGNNN